MSEELKKRVEKARKMVKNNEIETILILQGCPVTIGGVPMTVQSVERKTITLIAGAGYEFDLDTPANKKKHKYKEPKE